jgi:glycerophosphoryl diester phosphodiesterase
LQDWHTAPPVSGATLQLAEIWNLFDLQGHRGARGLWPENTLAGFARTIELGVSTVELDCGATRDGIVVVSHDPRLNGEHTRDAHGHFLGAPGAPIWQLDYAQLQAFDVGRIRPGSALAAEFPEQQSVDGERIPPLAEVLRLVRERGRGQVRINIEVKIFPLQPELTMAPDPFVQLLKRDLEATGTAALVYIQSFDWRVLQAVHRHIPGVATAALTDEQPGEDTVQIGAAQPSPWLGGLNPAEHGNSVPRLVRAIGAGTWAPDYRDLNAARVAEAHALGLRVVPWTVNEPADMAGLVAQGVDGIITDRPDRLRALLQQQGRAVPAPLRRQSP